MGIIEQYNRYRIGENIIADYITKLGYKVVERNFECNQGEIDIIDKDKEELVFIEVKTRTDISYGEASEAVTNTKKRHLINSIKYYIYKQKLENQPIRIDVAEVYINKGKVKVNYIKQKKIKKYRLFLSVVKNPASKRHRGSFVQNHELVVTDKI